MPTKRLTPDERARLHDLRDRLRELLDADRLATNNLEPEWGKLASDLYSAGLLATQASRPAERLVDQLIKFVHAG